MYHVAEARSLCIVVNHGTEMEAKYVVNIALRPSFTQGLLLIPIFEPLGQP